MTLRVSLDESAHAPGGTVRGRVLVTESAEARSLNVALRFWEKSPDYSHCAIEVPGPSFGPGAITAGLEHAFALVLPDGAMPGFASPHGRLYWEVDVWLDRFGSDHHERVEFQVVPGGVRRDD